MVAPGGQYFDRSCSPISFFEFSELASNERYCRIGSFEDRGVRVSTVWMGIQLDPDDQLIFETRIFGGDYGAHCCRYRRLEDARRGHLACVEDVQLGRKPWWDRDLNLEDLPELHDDDILRDELE